MPFRRSHLALVVLTLVGLALPPTMAVAQETADGQASVIFIVDTSGSMGGTPLAQAKAALTTSIAALPASQPIGLRSYAGVCSNGGILQVAVDTGNRADLEAAVAGLSAGGGTPTPAALVAGVDDLPEDPDGRVVVLISDGASSCGDPCPVAASLYAEADVEFKVHTVGFRAPGSAAAELQCIAEATGGDYFPAEDADELADAIGNVLDGNLPTYDEVQQKSTHNSYLRKESLQDQLVFHRIRSLELDIHTNSAPSQDWRVLHDSYPTDDYTTCNLLTDCLDELAAFHEAYPDHEVVTVFVDLKDDWDADHRPADFDALLTDPRFGGGDMVVSPGDLMAACPQASTLVEAVTREAGGEQVCDWPRLDALRGTFLFVLTDEEARQEEYVADGGSLAFRAPAVDTYPRDGVDDSDVVFLNHGGFDADLAADVRAAGLVVRNHGLNDRDEFDAARDAGVHHLATDKASLVKDPWAATHNTRGWPFLVTDPVAWPDAGQYEEPGRAITVRAQADKDLWKGAPDNFHFAHTTSDGVGADDWSVWVSTPNSHVPNKSGKACLMARASDEDDAAYFAVCRHADDKPLQVQWRDADGDFDHVKLDVAPDDTIEEESMAFLGLRLERNAAGQHCAVARAGLSRTAVPGSPTLGNQVVATHCFTVDLSLQGVASTSEHKSKPIDYIYSDLQLDDAAVMVEDLTQTQVGRSVGLAFDGRWMRDDALPPPLLFADFDPNLDQVAQFPIPVWEGHGRTRLHLFIMPQSVCLIPGFGPTCGDGDNRGFVTGDQVADYDVPARVKILADHERGLATVIAYRTHDGNGEVRALPIEMRNMGNIAALPDVEYPSLLRQYGRGIDEIRAGGVGFDFRFVNSVTPSIVAGAAPAIIGAVLLERADDGQVRIDYTGSPYPSLEVIRDSYDDDEMMTSTLVLTHEQNMDDPWGLYGDVFRDDVVG